MSFSFSEPLSYRTGNLMLNEQGAILGSGGEMENDETKADIIFRLISMQQKIDKFLDEGCTRITINFKDHSYIICLSNKTIYIEKKKVPALTELYNSTPIGDNEFNEDDYVQSTNVPITNSINA